MKELWDKRYAEKDYVYGIEPNQFFKEVLDKYSFKGKILLPAEGEGRNAVYAAKKGLEVFAFDTSNEGKNKALKLAKKENLEINYQLGAFFDLPLIKEKFDVVALVFAHFSPIISTEYHKKIAELIKPNAYIIIEGFSKSHHKLQKENPKAGGPKNIEMLYSIESISKDFPNFEPILLEEKEVELNEGKLHRGQSKLIRFIGRKIQ